MKIDNNSIAIICHYLMFFYSGIDKIINYNTKITNLKKIVPEPFKTFNNWVYHFCIIISILLLTIGSMLMILDSLHINKLQPNFKKMIIKLFIIWMTIVTVLIHHPFKSQKIPFLSNLSNIGGFIYMHENSC